MTAPHCHGDPHNKHYRYRVHSREPSRELFCGVQKPQCPDFEEIRALLDTEKRYI